MQGLLETLAEAIFLRGLSPGLAAVLLAAAPRKTGPVELKKIFVLDDRGEMAAEYSLDPDCPIEYNDFLRVLPQDGIGDRESLFVGEYVFTAFQSGASVFVLLSRGRLNPQDFDWIALLLKAAEAQMSQGSSKPLHAGDANVGELEKQLAERESRLQAREAELAKIEVRARADEANLRGRAEELDRQKNQLAATANQAAAARQTAASSEAQGQADFESRLTKAREELAAEKAALHAAKADLEAKWREASDQAAALKGAHDGAVATLERERSETTKREAEAAKMRAEIESRVQELSLRFANMAKERLLQSHKPVGEPSEAAKQAIEFEKAQIAKERKFLQGRAMEFLEKEEKVRTREERVSEQEANVQRREEDLTRREADLEHAKALVAQAPAPGAPVDEARRDLERRVKMIQQKALELLDREEKLKKRAEELQALENRLGIPAIAK